MSIVRPLKMVCGTKGETVILLVGNVPLRFHYRDALWVSAEIRRLAAVIKRAVAPNAHKAIRSAGILHDASAKPKPLPVQAGVAIHVKRREVRAKDLKVYPRGHSVLVQVGKDVLGIHWQDVFVVAQDIRLWAKRAMQAAGDQRHWSRVPSPILEQAS